MPRRQRIIDPDESEGEGEEEQTLPVSNRQNRNTNGTRASRQRAKNVAREDGEPCSTRQLERSRDDEPDDEILELEPSGQKCPTVGEAVLGVLALVTKGNIKEPDIKPLLSRGRFKDWHDGLDDLNNAFSEAFGITLVYDGPHRSFFVRNDFEHVKGELSELYSDGTLDGIRIDSGSGVKVSIPDEDEFNEDDKNGLLFTILSTIMMSNNVELGHKHWLVDEDILKHFCKTMRISDEVFKKTVSGYNAEFIRSAWLRKIEEKDANQDIMPRYTWGPRAVCTMSTLAVFHKFCMVNKQSPHEWGNYLEILKKLDEKNGLYTPR